MSDLAKMGRPRSENAKRHRVSVRFDDKDFDRLKNLAETCDLTITEAVRKGVEDMLDSKQ